MIRYFALTLLTGLSSALFLPTGPLLAEEANYQARGLVRAKARVSIRTDLVASVRMAPYRDGDAFSKGDKILEFDCSRYRAELNAAKALARAAAIEHRNKKRLYANGAAGKSEVSLAGAEFAKANADVKARTARISDCVIEAPFSGRVVKLSTKQYEMPKSNEPVITLIDDSALELELVVPSKYLRWLKPGERFGFHVDETGRVYQAEITRLGAEVDPVSQTIKSYGVLHGSLEGVLAGMSGTGTFDRGKTN